MDNKRLLTIIGEIDDEIIGEALDDRKISKRKALFIKIGALAACICLLVTAVFLIYMPSGTKIEKYKTLIYDTSNDGIGISSEFPSGNSYFTKKNMPAKSCTFQGKTYIGEYCKSIQNKGNSYVTDYYEAPSSIKFGFKEGTDEFVSISLLTKEVYETWSALEDVEDPEETASKIATEIAQEFINISEYSQEITKRPSFDVGFDVYQVIFERIVNGYHSSDYIFVTVTSKGTLASVVIGDINAFKDINIEFDPLEIENSLNEKIVNSYKERGFNIETTTIRKQCIVLTDNGDICMYSEVEVAGTQEGSTEKYESLIALITGLGKK